MKKCRLLILSTGFVLIIALTFFLWECSQMTETVRQWHSYKEDKELSTQWRKIKPLKKRKGVALVIHGLNLKPEKMNNIIRYLNKTGIDVLNVSLRGHGGNYEANKNISEAEARLDSFRMVDYNLWLQEVREGYDMASQRARRKNVPLYFVGYSLGGLLGCDLFLSNPENSFDGMILFAPALNLKAETYLLKTMMPFPNLVIDSLSPPSYRANSGTPMAAYKALFEAVDHFEKNINQQLNKPALLFIDEDDEFISADGIRDMIRKYKLDQWRLCSVRKDPEVGGSVSHHLIIDPDSVGKKMWEQMTDGIARNLRQ